MNTTLRHPLHPWLAAGMVCLATAARAADVPIALDVDARDATRRVLHATLRFPARPGPLTLVYPKWIPGEHGPTGPITDLVGLRASAHGQRIAWSRDPLDHYVFELEVPAGAETVEMALDFLLPPATEGFQSTASTEHLLVMGWHPVLLYPKGAVARSIRFAPRVRLPAGWKFASALPVVAEAGGVVEFAPVPLETLVDSPLIAGKHFRTFDLSPGSPVPHRLNVVADSATALEMKSEDRERFARLIQQAQALFAAWHYRKYDFLLALSDQISPSGLEHHESSDNRAPERMLVDEQLRTLWAGLLPHELVHSWNGKYRRPAGLATSDYLQPMQTDLLWIYEGLTTYLGDVLSARSGLWTPTNYLENLALSAAQLDHQRGRDWRPLADTAVAAHWLYTARPQGASQRRGWMDFYSEGALIWLEVDVLIRERTGGRRSLDDFCRDFFGGESGRPRVVAYTLDDVLAALNELTSYDWHGFFQERVYVVAPKAPLGGIERGGWRLVFRDTPSDLHKGFQADQKITDLSFSLGLILGEDGAIQDVLADSAAARAGVAAGDKLLAVNQRRYTPERLQAAVRGAKGGTVPIELLVENGDTFNTCRVAYYDGERYPHLERDQARPDLLSEILQARGSVAPHP